MKLRSQIDTTRPWSTIMLNRPQPAEELGRHDLAARRRKQMSHNCCGDERPNSVRLSLDRVEVASLAITGLSVAYGS
jgi:hypothetical protein